MIKASEFLDKNATHEEIYEYVVCEITNEIKKAYDEYAKRPIIYEKNFVCDVMCKSEANIITNDSYYSKKLQDLLSENGYILQYHSVFGFRIFIQK